MADMTAYLTEKHTRMIMEITKDLSAQLDKVANLQNIIRALKNPEILVDLSPLTLDRIQAMEDGSVRILPIRPVVVAACLDEIGQAAEAKNGKKENEEAEGAVDLVKAKA